MSEARTLPAEQSTASTAPVAQRAMPLAYRVDDAAALIGVSVSKLYNLIREGRLPARKLDGSTIIRHEDLIAFVNALPLVRQLAEPPVAPPPAPRPAPVAALAPPKMVPKPAPPRPVQPADLKPTAKYLRGPLSPDKILRTPTPGLASVIGPDPIRRPDALAKVWDYIRAHGLQAEVDRRIILADANFEYAFGLERVSMHDLNRLVKARLTPGGTSPADVGDGRGTDRASPEWHRHAYATPEEADRRSSASRARPPAETRADAACAAAHDRWHSEPLQQAEERSGHGRPHRGAARRCRARLAGRRHVAVGDASRPHGPARSEQNRPAHRGAIEARAAGLASLADALEVARVKAERGMGRSGIVVEG